MSRTHKQRHQWKDKERKRTTQSDPTKVVLHRERFVKKLGQQNIVQGVYESIVFQTRLHFKPEDNVTDIFYRGKMICTVPFLVENLEECHYALCQKFPELRMDNEMHILRQHVQRAKYLGSKCRLAKTCEQEKICVSSVSCPYRRWSNHKGQAFCTL